MNPEVRELIPSLVLVPGERQAMQPELFLERAGSSDGRRLALELLQEAVRDRDSEGVELGLILTDIFGADDRFLPAFLGLVTADWHFAHEDIVTMLGRLQSPLAVDPLLAVTNMEFEYLEYDDSRALATKSVHALARIPGVRASRALERIRDSGPSAASSAASRALGRRPKS